MGRRKRKADAQGPSEDASLVQPVMEGPPEREQAVAGPEEARQEEPEEPEVNGSQVWKCPDPRCRGQWIGNVGSNGWKAWKSHMARHAHSRPREARWDPKTVTPDVTRREKFV